MSFAADYREASSLVGGCWFEHVAHGITPLYHRSYHNASADDECEHGRLSGDRLDGKAPNWPHTHPCGCWPAEMVNRTPDLMTTLKTAKEAAMATNPNQYDQPTGPVHAPWGLKADGTPRKRPGRKPAATAAKPVAKAKPKAAARKLKLVPPTPEPDPITPAIAAIEAEITRVRAASDEQIARLTQTRETLMELARRAEAVAA